MTAIAARLEASRALSHRAKQVLAGGSTHDSWHVAPFPVAFASARGAWKTDVDGRAVVDYWMGHGALLLGHGAQPVVEALRAQAELGTHFAGLHELQVAWAERVQALVPCARRVRFVSSGTEAALLALRVARAYTGRSTVLRLDGHFHGWHDEALANAMDARAHGMNAGTCTTVEIGIDGDVDDLRMRLEQCDVAAVILEPGGGGGGALPMSRPFLAALREMTARTGTLLVFDEVVSGFRYAPGGVQSVLGIHPDICILAKILAGGLPGGAVAGREDVMAVFGDGIGGHPSHRRVVHTGTFNGNPLAAAAGIATLDRIADGGIGRAAEAAAQALVASVNAAAVRRAVDVRLFAQSSIFHVVFGVETDGVPAEPSREAFLQHNRRRALHDVLRHKLQLEGVDVHPFHGWVSAAHDDEAREFAVAAYERAFDAMSPELAVLGYA